MKMPLRKLLTWVHRYLGIALSLLFLMWFLTGIGMIYSRGMPRLTPEMRLARLAPLDVEAVRLTAAEAASRAGLVGPAGRATLTSVFDRPAYRFEERGTEIVFADTGERFTAIELEEAIGIASRFLDLPPERIEYVSLLTEPDQWTLTQGRQLPMYRLASADGAEVYVSARLGEVVQFTTRRGRLLSWVSVIPHFMYFKALRMNTDLWLGMMVWGPALGVVVSLAGILLGVVHFRPRRPFSFRRLNSYIPYTGWLRWHYLAGLAFGLVALTFVSSGLLSMEPWEWSARDDSLEQATRSAFPEGTGDLSDYPAIEADDWRGMPGIADVKEIEFTRVLGEPHLVARGAAAAPARMGWPDGGHQPYFVQRSVDPQRWVIVAAGLKIQSDPLPTEVILSRIEQAAPDVPILAVDTLDAYDSYYYSREQRAPLPVLRVQLEDPDRTWLYIDPYVARVVGRVNRVNRVERWLYAGLHTFDFPFLYNRRPLWDAVIIVFCLGGAMVSGIGALLGIKRVIRGVDRITAPGAA